MKVTYQTRIPEYAGMDQAVGDEVLSAYGELYGRVQRKLFADMEAGWSPSSLKREYLRQYQIPARLFNSVRVSLEGKIASVRETLKLRRDDLCRRIERAERVLTGVERRDVFHQKRRRLENLKTKLRKLESDIESGRVRLCFGSKRLWRRQYDLNANGYSSHDEWLRNWRAARGGEVFLLGSRDETAGCQLCVAGVASDGSLTLRLRVPDALVPTCGKYLVIPRVRFKYGHEQVLAALDRNTESKACRRRHGETAVRRSGLGQAISYRFKWDEKGWRVFVTTELAVPPVVTDRNLGAIGVDLNADQLAVSEVDGHGNWLRSRRVPLATYGKSRGQAEALIGDAVASVVAYARDAGKPIVLEKLDFRQKRSVLEGESPRYGRMLSSFSFGKVRACFLSRGVRQGVEISQVNPAFSSVIGRVKFMERYGLSAHQAAALVLARRSLGCSERIPRRRVYPVGNGVHVAFTVPARKRVKHVWSLWGSILGQLRPALAAQHRLGKRRCRPNPARAVVGDGIPPGGLGGDPFGVPG